MTVSLRELEEVLRSRGFATEVRGLVVVGTMEVLGAVLRIGATRVSSGVVSRDLVRRLEELAESLGLDVLVVVVPPGARIEGTPRRCRFVEESALTVERGSAAPELGELEAIVPSPTPVSRYLGPEPLLSLDEVVRHAEERGATVHRAVLLLYPVVAVTYRIAKTVRSLRTVRNVEKVRSVSYDGVTGEPVIYDPAKGIDYSPAVLPELGRLGTEVLEEVLRAPGTPDAIARRLLVDAGEVKRVLEAMERAGLVEKIAGGVYRARIELLPITAAPGARIVEMSGLAVPVLSEPRHVYPRECEASRETVYYPYALILGERDGKRVAALVDMLTGRSRNDVLRRLREAQKRISPHQSTP